MRALGDEAVKRLRIGDKELEAIRRGWKGRIVRLLDVFGKRSVRLYRVTDVRAMKWTAQDGSVRFGVELFVTVADRDRRERSRGNRWIDVGYVRRYTGKRQAD